ncbi:MAG: polyphosphate kinase 1 [Lentisphaerae bacterium]|nr:polyphosphate kinase 1 [Lentisphaerota bacterium]
MNTTIRKPKAGSTTSSENPGFISRELSWLDFNARVLDEAGITANPLLERLKFISIFSSNLDEFFMVRIADLRHLIRAGETAPDPAGNSPESQLQQAHRKISGLLKKQYSLLNGEILPQLADYGIRLRNFKELSVAQKKKLGSTFTRQILPVLTPLAIQDGKPFPLLNSGTIEIAVRLEFPKSGKKTIAAVEVPELLDRFIRIPGTVNEFILMEELIAAHIAELFPGGRVQALQIFRITRDMDYALDNDDYEDLLHHLQDKLRQRSRRDPVRVEFSATHSDLNLQKYLAASLELEPEYCYRIPGMLHLKQFSSLIDLINMPELQEAPWKPVLPEIFTRFDSVFSAIANQKDILLVHPYQSFAPIVKLLEEAAADPDVIAIKQTLYRVSGNSPVVKALQRAAENGKQVTVLVELKARFDESNNIAWAELLDHSGAHVVYGIPGLKVHCKTLLIVRKESGTLRRYLHLGTGNYNDKTAELYTDLSLLTCDEELCTDAALLFNLLTGGTEPPDKWHKLSVSPFNLRSDLIRLIEHEISLGRNGRIIAKMNSLSDPQMIRLLHRAAAAGVKTDLIVRGICCLRPLPNEKNLRIISIIDRYLEHSRIFFFGNNGDGKLFCSSADWMTRNLDRRVETMFPVKNRRLQNIIMTLLEYHLHDRDKMRILKSSGNYTKPAERSWDGSRSQQKIYSYISEQITSFYSLDT